MGADESAPRRCESKCIRGEHVYICNLVEGHGAEHWSPASSGSPIRWASAPKIEVDVNVKGEDMVNAFMSALEDAVVSQSDTPDPVAHPPYYTRFPVEIIQITEHLNFCRGNVVKYVCRAGAKDGEDEVTPLRKAHWYLERELARIDPNWRKK